MRTLVASLADNKAALGRRYAEWAVSAPTLESAVAAAAMAQDELGHSRSTYPVLKQLGEAANDDGWGGDRRLALLDDELPDWNAFIAANLLVDGVLTTFVAACVDSSVEPMAARARKILQEEGSHRVHGEAWARRLCRGAERDAFVARLRETWEHAGRWIGPDDDRECAAALAAGEIKLGPAQQREAAVAAPAVVAGGLAELLEHRVGRARVPELVLGHGGGGHRGLERGGGHRPLRVAPAERGLVVGERGDERLHGLIASRIAGRGTMIMWIHGCSS
jgi:1,2-phenylacetyl-CoA epoxidase catalytic subunit